MMQKPVRRIFETFVNSLCYIKYRNPLVVSAYVGVKHGKVTPRNWGDDINVFLLEKISGRKVVIKNESLYHKLANVPSFLCIGSTIGFMMDESTKVWGAGAMHNYRCLPHHPLNVSAVRGPLTRNVLINAGVECPTVYGDPALLLSRYYQPCVTKTHRLGVIVHYTDENNPILEGWLAKHPEILHIKMRDYKRWEEIPDKICSCEEIWSSSLHGLIISDSYSIPNRWIRLNGKVAGGDFKYRDYLSSVGRENTSVITIVSEKQLEDLLEDRLTVAEAIINYDGILSSCPFIAKD